MNFRILALITFLFPGHVVAQEINFKIYNPGDSQPEGLADKLVPYVNESVGKLISHLKEPRESDFISATDAKPTLKWRGERLTIISNDVVAVSYTEGHVGVIGIYVRNEKERRWDLKSEIHGTFRVRSFADPPEERKAAGGGDKPPTKPPTKPPAEIKR